MSSDVEDGKKTEEEQERIKADREARKAAKEVCNENRLPVCEFDLHSSLVQILLCQALFFICSVFMPESVQARCLCVFHLLLAMVSPFFACFFTGRKSGEEGRERGDSSGQSSSRRRGPGCLEVFPLPNRRTCRGSEATSNLLCPLHSGTGL